MTKKLLIAVALVLGMGLFIYQTTPKQEKNLTFVVTEGEANLIIQGLQELPAKVSNPLTQKLITQAQTQIAKDTLQKKK